LGYGGCSVRITSQTRNGRRTIKFGNLRAVSFEEALIRWNVVVPPTEIVSSTNDRTNSFNVLDGPRFSDVGDARP
jgi:hypothetical protein